jgi:NADP-dependent 3-hydroxy acid dehydrogenase YdfG
VGLAVEPADIGSTEGRLDILVNDAGSSSQIPHANLRASTTIPSTSSLCQRASAPLLKATGRGLVVNAGSVAGIGGVGSSIAYAACCWSSAAFS